MSSLFALVFAALAGFVSLSHEILWFRAFGFVTGGSAASFGLVLGAFLLGLAGGAFAARRFCGHGQSGDRRLLLVPAVSVLAATVGGFLTIPALGWIVTHTSWVYGLALVALVAGAFGTVLPLVSHFGIAPDERAGERLSHLYLANIVGSGGGSLLTGLWLLDRWGLVELSVGLAFAGLALALLLACGATHRLRLRLGLGGAAAMAVPAFVLVSVPAFDAILEKLQLKQGWNGRERFVHVLETKSGIVTVRSDGTCYGGGVYDGVFSTDPVDDKNMIVRAYALPAIHPKPRRVLMVGLSTGSWAQVVVNQPDVEQLVVVEISRGYPEMIRSRPQVASLLTNPKLSLVIDDGRRWLAANPNERFDVVVQNTTWHWRGHATNLLSREYHELVRAHLNPGGVSYYNATGSSAAQRTACSLFRHGYRIVNFIAVSDSPLVVDHERMRRSLEAYEIDGRKVFDLSLPRHRQRLEQMALLVDPARPDAPREHWLEPCSAILQRTQGVPEVTDDNMATEVARAWWRTP